MTRRYRAGDSVPGFGPPFAVLDEAAQAAIALCWTAEAANRIVLALNLYESGPAPASRLLECIFCTRPREPDSKFCERHRGGSPLADD